MLADEQTTELTSKITRGYATTTDQLRYFQVQQGGVELQMVSFNISTAAEDTFIKSCMISTLFFRHKSINVFCVQQTAQTVWL